MNITFPSGDTVTLVALLFSEKAKVRFSGFDYVPSVCCQLMKSSVQYW